MSFSNLLIKNNVNNLKNAAPLVTVIRHGHVIRGKPPGVARTLEQRLQEENAQDPVLTARVNIGFPQLKTSRSQQLKERLQHLKQQRTNKELEKLARNNQLLIDVDEVQREYRQTIGQYDLRVMADHYGIYEHLFGAAYFIPRVPLDIKYEVSPEVFSPVYNGNVIKPSEASKPPLVEFESSIDPITGKKASGDSYWTLIATNPDGNLKANDCECLHWFVGNIPNGEIAKGEVLAEYLQPFPPKGIGYQRFVFVLYKQNSKLDFGAFKITPADSANLDKRSFKTLDFYGIYQDQLTPAGLAFYQTDWDKSLTDFYHNKLGMKEPIYEYDFPKAYLSDQKFFPLKQPFNLYMDKHRDPKEVNKEWLLRKLSKTHPFEGPEEPLRFPNAHPLKGMPSWLKTEIRKERLGIGRVNDYK